MKTLFFLVLVVVTLIWVGRMMRRREIEKFRESDSGLLNEFRQEVAPRLETSIETPALTSFKGTLEPSTGTVVGSSVPPIEQSAAPIDAVSPRLKSIVFNERQRRYLELIEALLTDRYRVFVNLPVTDLMATSNSGRVAFVICDGQYLSVEVILAFKDEIDQAMEALLLGASKPLLILRGNEKQERVKELLSELNVGLVQTQDKPLCPRCHGDMRLRAPESGKHAGKRFWLCTSYPQCRGTQPG